MARRHRPRRTSPSASRRSPPSSREVGLDPATDWLPVAPAAHYCCGGVVADLDGATSLPGLWAAGEVACNGVMGANRLASNSLLDGMVFAPRAVEAIERGVDGPSADRRHARRARRRRRRAAASSAAGGSTCDVGFDADAATDRPGRAAAGDERRRRRAADGRLAGGRRPPRPPPAEGDDVEAREVANLATVAQALVAAATAREETRAPTPGPSSPTRDDRLLLRFVVGG